MNRRFAIASLVGISILVGAGSAAAAGTGSDAQGHRVCVVVMNDPNSPNRDGICIDTIPILSR